MSDEGARRTAAVTGGILPESLSIDGGAQRLRCLLWGRPGDPLAVLVHGNGGHAHWWDALVPALVPGWRLVAPDLRGHGESDWAEPPSYSLRDFADDLTTVLDRLAAGPAVLVGHSMGGRVVAWYAAQHPERVRGLAVLDARMTAVDRASAARWRAQVAGKRHGPGYPTRAAAMQAFHFVPDEPDVSPEVVDDLAFHAVTERGPGDWTFGFDRAVLSLDGDGERNLERALGRIRCPTLFVSGESSWVVDAEQRRALAAAVPAARVQVFPGGHHFLLAHPGPVGAALRVFLDGLG